jgi:hypothetical protein
MGITLSSERIVALIHIWTEDGVHFIRIKSHNEDVLGQDKAALLKVPCLGRELGGRSGVRLEMRMARFWG